MSIGVVLIVVAIPSASRSRRCSSARAPSTETEASLREFLQRQPGVEKVFRLLTLQLGTSLMVAVKVKMKPESAAELVAAINRAEAATRAEFPEIQWLFFEPDVAD